MLAAHLPWLCLHGVGGRPAMLASSVHDTFACRGGAVKKAKETGYAIGYANTQDLLQAAGHGNKSDMGHCCGSFRRRGLPLAAHGSEADRWPAPPAGALPPLAPARPPAPPRPSGGWSIML